MCLCLLQQEAELDLKTPEKAAAPGWITIRTGWECTCLGRIQNRHTGLSADLWNMTAVSRIIQRGASAPNSPRSDRKGWFRQKVWWGAERQAEVWLAFVWFCHLDLKTLPPVVSLHHPAPNMQHYRLLYTTKVYCNKAKLDRHWCGGLPLTNSIQAWCHFVVQSEY